MVRGTTNRVEQLKLFGRWDAIGRLGLAELDEVDPRDAAEIFAVAKTPATATEEAVTRQIIHRKRRNMREAALKGHCRFMPNASMLT